MNPIDTQILQSAKDRLLAGDVVAIPTETVYGLAASIENESGLRKIFQLKERPFFDPLIVHVASIKDAMAVTREWPPIADYLARVFWPGPLTLVLPKAESVNPLITSGLDTVAVRYPSHPLTLDLIKLVRSPLAAPSANKFGRTSPSRAEHVRQEFKDSNLLIIDGGPCEIGLESTVLSFAKTASGDDEIVILRPGGITTEVIENSLTKWSKPVTIRTQSSEASPGHLKHHYMPSVPLAIVPETEEDAHALSKKTLEKISRLLPQGSRAAFKNPCELELDENPELAARELYTEMRRLSEQGADLIFVRATKARQGGLWSAIWDRLNRAATVNISGNISGALSGDVSS